MVQLHFENGTNSWNRLLLLLKLILVIYQKYHHFSLRPCFPSHIDSLSEYFCLIARNKRAISWIYADRNDDLAHLNIVQYFWYDTKFMELQFLIYVTIIFFTLQNISKNASEILQWESVSNVKQN